MKQLEGLANKTKQKMSIKDYETKVPEDVRTDNKERLEVTLSEMKTLQDCIADLKKMI